jgi:hypothetical protein
MNLRSRVEYVNPGSRDDGKRGYVVDHWKPPFPDHPTLNVILWDDWSTSMTDDSRLERVREGRS